MWDNRKTTLSLLELSRKLQIQLSKSLITITYQKFNYVLEIFVALNNAYFMYNTLTSKKR